MHHIWLYREHCPDDAWDLRNPDGSRPSKESFANFVQSQLRKLTDILNARNGNDFASTRFAEPLMFHQEGKA